MSPRCAILTPILGDETQTDALALTVASVDQLFGVSWEHLLIGDDPDGSAAQTAQRRWIQADDGDWMRAGLDATDADFVVVLLPGDRCRPNTLAVLTNALQDTTALVYADHSLDVPDLDGDDDLPNRSAPFALKPAFSPELLRGKNYVANAALVRRDSIGADRFDPDPVTAIHDLVLRAADGGEVATVPLVLFHLAGPTASLAPSRAAVEAHLRRRSIDATVEEREAGLRIRRKVDDDALVSVVVPTRGSTGREWGATRAYVVDAVRSVLEASTYQNLEFVVVYDLGTPRPVLDALERLQGRVRLIEYDKPFNFSDKVNVGVAEADGDLLLLLNDDTELIEPRSIETMVGLVRDPDVGAVGARLLFADGTLQHGGHTYYREMLHACLGWPGDSPGPRPLTPLAVSRELTGVTAAAMMVRRDVFEEVGGMSADFPVNFNDVDFCLKVRSGRYRILWSPDAAWYHFEGITRGRGATDAEADRIFGRWNAELNLDPYYSTNLYPKRADWVELPGLDSPR